VRPGIACADSPHHITSIFAPYEGRSLDETGSIGAGIAVEPRLRACYSSEGTSKISTVKRVARLLGIANDNATLITPLPPASGYAVSAAGAVAAALSFTAGRLPVEEALRAAHRAEVLEGTGLGDVLAISCGVGIVLRTKPGAPGVGATMCMQVPGTVSILSVETGKMHTSNMLANLRPDFASLARKYLEKLFEDYTFESFAYYSERFSKESGLLANALGGRELPKLPGIIGVYGKKRVLVFLVEKDRAADAAAILEKWGARPRLLEPSRGPPRVWWS
jgi:pantoate kinase